MSSETPLYWAHTPPENGGNAQSMRDHNLAVAKLSKLFGEIAELGELCYYAGLIHDLGKYSPDFQQYLRDCHQAKLQKIAGPKPGSVPHKEAGAALAYQKKLPTPLSYVILGHHGEIPSRDETKTRVKTFDPAELKTLTQILEGDCPEAITACPDPAGLPKGSLLEQEMRTRFVRSCVVDADCLDTEAHFSESRAAVRNEPRSDLVQMLACLEKNQAAFMKQAKKKTNVSERQQCLNTHRRVVYERCQAAAELGPGVYRLTVPTGGGKTRSSLGFALKHAVKWHKSRVIYALPFCSIVDQTADEFESIFSKLKGGESVLVHHSAIEENEGGDAKEKKHAFWRRLACQNWDAPLVITTTVQLFESLLGSWAGRSRKIHNIANSVIVLDEIQALPVHLIRPLVDLQRRLHEDYNCTLLLCTATQPCLTLDTVLETGFGEVHEIIPEPAQLFSDLRRVEYDLSPLEEPEGWSWARTAEEIKKHSSVVVVVNTRPDSVHLWAALEDESAYYLSTYLCGHDRRRLISEIKIKLKKGEPVRCISTQLIEAGVDLDFRHGFRAEGTMQGIVQTAGRVNREFEQEMATLTVFRPKNGKLPADGSYRTATQLTRTLLKKGVDLNDPAVHTDYFQKLYHQIDQDPNGVQKLREEFDFPKVAEQFQMIRDDDVELLVFCPGVEEKTAAIVHAAQAEGKMTRELWRRAQPYLVSMPKSIQDTHGALIDDQSVPGLLIWNGKYDPKLGLGIYCS